MVMFAAHTATPKLDNNTFSDIQQATWDRVVHSRHLIGDNRLIVPPVKASGAALALAMDHAATHSVVNWEGSHHLFFVGVAHLLHGKFGCAIKDVDDQGEHFFKMCFEECTEGFCCNLMLNFKPGSMECPNFLVLKKVEQSKKAAPKVAWVKSNNHCETALSKAHKSNNNRNDN